MPRQRSLRSAPGLVQIDNSMFDDIEQFIKDNENRAKRFNKGITALAMLLAQTTRGYAQARSRGRLVMTEHGGRVDSTRWNVARRPFGIPVDRWTGEYYLGWKVKYLGPGKYVCYNDSGHAQFIELGINPRSRYIGFRRRPVMKLSVRDMLRQIEGTRTFERFTYGVFQTGNSPRLDIY